MTNHSYLNTIAAILIALLYFNSHYCTIAPIIQQNEGPNFSRDVRTCTLPHFMHFLGLFLCILLWPYLCFDRLSMSDLMMRNQILGLRRAGMSVEEISVALEIDVMGVKLALEATGGSVAVRKAVKEDSSEDITDDVSEQEAKEMMGIIKNIARDEESGVYARLNAAKYAHGAKRGYHKRHLDMNVGSGELLLKINEAYMSASMRARAALTGQSLTAKELTVIEAPTTVEANSVEPIVEPQLIDQTTPSQPAALNPRPFKI